MNKEYYIKLQATIDDSQKTVSELNSKIKTLESKVSELKLKVDSQKVSKANKQLKSLNDTAKEGKKQADKWQYSWSKAFQSFTTYMSVTTVFYQTVHAIRDMINEVVELDGALVELKKVTDLEGVSLQRFTKEAYEVGANVAKTGTEMVEAATSFAKAGYSEDQILKLGEVATMYTNIADEAISSADAANFIIAQLKAFNLESKDMNKTLSNAYHIIDAVNEVSNNFAVSSSDIATNLGKASSVMANAGNSLEQMIGLMVSGTEITRNASKVANGLKTITLRLQGMDDEGEKNLELMSQMEGLFNKLGKTVYNTDGTLKNTYDLLGELADVYPTLTAAEKAYVTETIAGKYQAQNAAAILSNWKTAVDATATALNSQGSAMNENNKYMDSIQGKLKQLSSAWEELSKNVFNSDFLKFVVDLGTGFLNLANSGLGQATIKIAAFMLIFKSISKLLATVHTRIVLLTNGFVKNSAAIIMNSKLTKDLSKNTKNYIVQLLAERGAINKNTGAIKASTLEKIKAKLASRGLTAAEQAEILKTLTISSAYKAATKATFTFKGAINGLTAAIAANPIGAALLAITGLISGLQYLADTTERTQSKYKELKQEFEESKQKLETTNEELENTKKKISELKAKGSLTFTEKQELDNLEKANIKLETQAELYERIAKAKEKAAKKAANDAYDKDYNGKFSYKQVTNKGELKDMEWYDYINPKHIYDFFSNNTANYGYDTNIITEAVNLYSDLNEKRKDGIKLSKEEQAQYENLESSLATELEKLEEKIPDLTGKTKKAAEDLRNYIVRFVYPETFQKEQANKFFGVDLDDKGSQKIKEQFSDIQNQMDELYKKGELTSKKIWELRKDQEGNWNELDEYMRDTGLNAEGIITYFDTIYESVNKTSEVLSEKWTTAVKNFNTDIDKLQSAFSALSAAQEEYNESGYISIDTLQTLLALDDEYLGYLVDENGQLSLNKDAFINLAQAKINDLIATEEQRHYNEVLNISNQKLNNTVKKTIGWFQALWNVIKGGKASVSDATRTLSALEEEINRSGTDAQQAALAAENEKYENRIAILKATLESVNKNFNSAMGVSGPSGGSYGSRGSSSSSKKSGKEWWETELENLKNQFKYNEITIEEYIRGLDNLLGKVQKGTDAWRKINEELQKQRLTKVEDDYKRGTISLDEYIKKLKELIKAYKQGSDAWNDLADKIKKALQDKADKQKDDLGTAENAAVGIIDDEIDKLKKLKEEQEDYYDKLIDDKKAANEETEKELELARLQEALENAKKEKTKRVKYMLSIKIAQNGENPEEDNTVGKICFEI